VAKRKKPAGLSLIMRQTRGSLRKKKKRRENLRLPGSPHDKRAASNTDLNKKRAGDTVKVKNERLPLP